MGYQTGLDSRLITPLTQHLDNKDTLVFTDGLPDWTGFTTHHATNSTPLVLQIKVLYETWEETKNREKYETILNKIKIGLKGHSSDYYHMQRFDVLHCGDVEKLIKKRQSLTDPILYYAYAEEIYSIIMRAHLNTGHGGRDKMLKEVNKKSPYKAMFGCDAKIGISSSSLPQEILGSLQTEEDLIQHLQISDKPDEISNDFQNELSSDKPNQLDEESQLNTALNLSETQETELDVQVCAVCENPCFSIIQCSTCAQYIHELCSNGTIPDTITCHLCSNEEVIRNERRYASDSMTKQAVRMRNLSERVLTEVDVGANVLVAIPHVDRGKGDPRKLMAVVTGKEEHGYKLGIKDGILRGLYTRNQFELSDNNFIAIHCVNYDNEISFRKAVSKVSLCDGQGYTKCG
ncbi:unnamed protein product [Mytilus edulis]|uniref:Uncharacterized protein n=1 Tax=Mytilus edulis TaxID=6550 RepID=A0A8S3SBP6_MYTED|nr:unnamed protein product [Mytilus edulis]